MTPSHPEIRSPRGSTLTAKSWLTEAPLRMLMNNLDPEVAERPGDLVVYGGIGRAVRNWDCYERTVAALKRLELLALDAGLADDFFEGDLVPLAMPA